MTLLETRDSSPWIRGTGSEPATFASWDDLSAEGTGTIPAPSMVGSTSTSEGARSCSDVAGLTVEFALGWSEHSPVAKTANS